MPAFDNMTQTEPTTTTVDVGQLQSQDYTGNLMNYGMAGVNPFEFVKMVQTGQVTFDNTDPDQQRLLDEYERRAQEANANDPNANLPSVAQVLGGLVVGVGGPLVANTFGNAYANTGGNFGEALSATVKSPFGGGAVSDFKIGDTSEAGSKLLKGTYLKGDNWFKNLNKIDKSTITDRSTLDLIERVQRKATPDGVYRLPNNATELETTSYNNDVIALKKAGLETTVPTAKDYTTAWTSRSNIGSSVAVGGTTFVGALIAGAKPKQAAKLAVGTGLGKYLGTAVGSMMGFGGPIGGYLGSLVGGALGGRVICNELMRQGILDRKHVLLDYRFTRDYLTPTHVRGYHVWAVWMVKQMRKGKFVKFWKHVAGHRANEIAYIYGERDKPDYLGKVYRKILEPICWSVGLLCKKSDWSILYKTKEI
jgi:hypothetical protein